MDMALEYQALRNRIDLLGMDAEAIGRLVRSATLQAVALDFAKEAEFDRAKVPGDAVRTENADFEYMSHSEDVAGKNTSDNV